VIPEILQSVEFLQADRLVMAGLNSTFSW